MPKEKIKSFIDFFYPPFRTIMPLRTFRYAACGGANVLLGFILFTCIFHFVLDRKIVDLGFFAFESYSVALFISSSIVFIVGFLLNKYVVFIESNLRGRIQFFRYFLSFFTSLLINYILLKLSVESLHIDPVLAQIMVTAIVVTFSYFTQHYFTFRIKETE